MSTNKELIEGFSELVNAELKREIELLQEDAERANPRMRKALHDYEMFCELRLQRDEARAALVELLRGLAGDDEPRRRAVETAMALTRKWAGE